MIDQSIQKAHLLLEQKRYKEAEKELKTILASQPSNEEAHSLMAIIKNHTDDIPAALEHIHTAIASNPGKAYLYYIKASILLHQNREKEAESVILEAISLDPTVADFYSLLAFIEMQRKNWQNALDYANQGLSLEPDNLQCLNTRSTALIKLDKKEASYETIKEALHYDPDNSYTHANVGWGFLEKGDQKKSLDHFKKALQSDPNNEYAKAGIVEALKARFWVYRLFLRYSFWIANLKGNAQWAIMLGFFFGSRVLRYISNSYPFLEPFIMPLIILYTVFALSTWLIKPISNLFLRLNTYGRYALSKEEVKSSNYVGVSLIVGLTGLMSYFASNYFPWLAIAILGLTLMLPFSSMYDAATERGLKILKFYTLALVVVGTFSVLLAFAGFGIYYVIGMGYLIGIFAYQWVVNAFVIR
jgi:Tfp pilus assembly protein PilF